MRLIISCVLMLFCTQVTAQFTEQIETDRPDQTESPYTVPKKWFQSETGFNFEKDRAGLRSLVHPTMLNKYGLGKRFELRLITELVSVETALAIPAGNDVYTGLLPVKIGGKLALFEEKGLRPKTSFIFHMMIPKAASEKFQREHWAPEFRFTMQHSLSETVSLGYNLGAEWDGEDEDPSWIYTLVTGFNLGEKWYSYAEIFGAFKKNQPNESNLDGGVAYNVSNNVKIDLSAGLGLEASNPLKYYVALGFSFRIPTGKAKSSSVQ